MTLVNVTSAKFGDGFRRDCSLTNPVQNFKPALYKVEKTFVKMAGGEAVLDKYIP